MKPKYLLVVLILNTFFTFSQTETTSKRIVIYNPTDQEISKLPELGIDLRCGAVFSKNSLHLELTSFEVENLKNAGILFDVEIEDLTKFYSERAEKELPLAKSKLQVEKAKNQLKKKSKVLGKTATSISNVDVDSYLQYYGESEVDWITPANFVYGSMGGCLTVSEMEAQLDLMKSLFPSLITTKKSASTSNKTTYGFAGSGGWSGQTVYFVKISDGILIDDSSTADPDDISEPDILYTSMIHSRELSSLMGNIYFMWYLLENYATDPAVKNLVDNNELFFVPVVNPDGLRWNEKIAPTGGGLQRKNLRGFTNIDDNTAPITSNMDPTNNGTFATQDGVDVNRNFGYLWGSAGDSAGSDDNYGSNLYRGDHAFSEPESQIMKEFVLAKNFKTAVWQHTYANAIPHPYGGIPTKVSGREDEMHKWHEDMTRYNRYIYGARVLNSANGIADDWMLGGTADSNGSIGSGMNILATTPENGHFNERDISNGYSGFWPLPSNIIPIAKRMMRINFMNAYYGGKYAKFHDLTQSDITDPNSDLTEILTFGIERIGQTASDFTLTVTPISSNIKSIVSPAKQTGMSILDQRNLTATIEFYPGISVNDKIEYKVTLSNDSFVIYEANFEKYYSPTVIFEDNPDTDISLSNWVETSNWSNSNISSWSGSRSIKAGSSIPYSANISNTLTTTNSYNLSGSNKVLVQFYSKWDLERNFDFVEILGSSDNGTTWVKLNGKYNKPESVSTTNDARQYYDSAKNSYFSFQSNSSGLVYDGDQMDNWVLEEIVIDASNNSSLLNATDAKFRFNFRTDGNNSAENYSANYEGFYFDDFKIIEVPCNTSVPTGLGVSSISNASVTIDWNNISAVTYDLRFKQTSSSTWINLLDIAINTFDLTGLSASTEYEVQVRSKCDVSTTSAYSSSAIFTTTAAPPCTGTVFSDFATGYSESFENTIGDWIQGANGLEDDIDWTNLSGATGSANTGPSSAFDGSFYLYTEASTNGTGFPNKEAILISPCFDLSGYKDAQFTFYYNWFGADITSASLTVGISSDNGNSFTNVYTKTGASNNNWVPQTISLSSYNGETIKIKISGITGTNFASDMAIDNFSLTASPDASLGIQDEVLSAFQLYPNPSDIGEIRLKVPNEIQEFNVIISNTLGQKLYSKTLENYNSKTHKINTQGFKTGIYIVTVSTNLGKSTKKLVIQ